jgi:hypothetical protein
VKDLSSLLTPPSKTEKTMATTTSNYVEEFLPPSIVEKLEAGAWKSLCDHLRDRSDEVQNIDLMTVSGFCRNCLAKASLLVFFKREWCLVNF